jgi:two-component system response regulator
MKPHDVEILLVEDNADDAELALRALQKNLQVQKVHLVRDGEEALNFLFGRGAYRERACKPLPQLILLDLKLPKIDGLAVLRTLKQDPRTRWVPVIILTSSSEGADIIASYDMGVNSYVQKPVDFDQFHETLRTLTLYWLTLNQQPPPLTLADNTEKSG